MSLGRNEVLTSEGPGAKRCQMGLESFLSIFWYGHCNKTMTWLNRHSITA